MKFEDLLQESEQDLSPIFSGPMLSITLGALWLMTALLFLSWPHSPLSQHLLDARLPWSFFITFSGALIITAYIQMRCGLGEIIPKVVSARMEREGLTTREEQSSYFSYGLPQAVLHILILLALFFPILFLGGTISGASLGDFLAALAVVFSASLLCRQAAFILLLTVGRWHWIGYLGARLFYLWLLGGTGFFCPSLNPPLLLFNIHFGDRIPLGPTVPSWLPYGATAFSLILVFAWISQWLIRRKNRRRRIP